MRKIIRPENKDFGFTLIEMVVIISVMAIVIVTISTTLLNSFRARNKVDLTDTLEQNGSYVIDQITNDFLNSNQKNAVCAVGGSSLTLINKNDGQATTILCTEGADVASNSAALTQGVTVSNCTNFVKCSLDPTTNEVTAINIGFTLSVIGSGDTGSRSFQTTVTARD